LKKYYFYRSNSLKKNLYPPKINAMATGFTPKYSKDFILSNLTTEEFLVIAREACLTMKWSISFISHSGIIAYTDNGIFARNAEIKIIVKDNTARFISSSTGTEMYDFGKNKKNITSCISAFESLQTSYTTEELVLKYEELQSHLVSDQEDVLKLPPPTTTEKVGNFFSIFIPVKGFFITPILINLNILIFILMAVGGANILLPDTGTLLSWGANFRPITLEGQWWRLLTNCFLHIGIFHLLMNMYALLFIGILLEPHIGRARLLSAYLLTGIMASVCSIYWHDITISAGASGAIFGMYGVFLAMLTTNLIEKTARKALLASIVIFVVYNLINGMKEGIDNAAHIGGLISGLIIGYAFIPGLKKPDDNNLKYINIASMTAIVLFSAMLAYKTIPNDIAEYDKKMTSFISFEAMALDVFKYPENSPKNRLLYGLRERGTYYWTECINVVDDLDKLDLPAELLQKNKKLRNYCNLRIKSYELYYKKINENTTVYDTQIEEYNTELKAIVEELTAVKQAE